MNLEKWFSLREKTAELSLRERVILAAATVVIVVFVWLQLVFNDIEKSQQKLVQKKTELSLQSIPQSERLVELTTILADDPNAPLRTQQQELNEQLLALRQQIESRLSNLIAPEKMADVMKSVLSDYKGLRLISARNLPVEPLKIEAQKEEPKKLAREKPRPEAQAVIFAHGFEMVLSGNYFQTLEFLQHLEQMSGFYWQKLDYEVDKYPNAKITLQLNTLSLEEGWIGV